LDVLRIGTSFVMGLLKIIMGILKNEASYNITLLENEASFSFGCFKEWNIILNHS
tara:strand:- start:45 stop:209 length:165 start_codon:yes stop_codon:yes gene_type:complete